MDIWAEYQQLNINYIYKSGPLRLASAKIAAKRSLNGVSNTVLIPGVTITGFVSSDTPNGAKASAAICSIVETAKANGLNVYTYLNYILEQMPNMNWAVNPEVLEALMPWNDQVQQACR